MKQFPKSLLGSDDFDEISISDDDPYDAKVLKFLAMEEEQFEFYWNTVAPIMDALEEANYIRRGERATVH